MTLIMPQTLMIPALAAGIVLLTTNIGRAEPYRDADRHFTLELPDGWEMIPTDRLKFLKSVRDEGVGRPFAGCVGGFWRPSEMRPDAPVVFIYFQHRNLQGMSPKEIEREWAAGYRKNIADENEKGRRVSEESPVAFDRAAKRFVMRSRMDDALDSVVSYGIGVIGKDTVVLLECYALRDEFAQWQPTFDAIGASFRFDPGHAFETETDGSGGGLIGVIGAAAVIGVSVVVKLARKGHQKRLNLDT